MIKKVLIAGLFIGGGLYFIKRILPKTSSNLSSKEVDALSVDEVVEKENYSNGIVQLNAIWW